MIIKIQKKSICSLEILDIGQLNCLLWWLNVWYANFCLHLDVLVATVTISQLWYFLNYFLLHFIKTKFGCWIAEERDCRFESADYDEFCDKTIVGKRKTE